MGLTWFAGRRWFGARSGWVASLLVAIHWSAVYYGGEFLDSSLLSALVMAYLVGLGRLADRTVARHRASAKLGSGGAVLAVGVAVGLAAGTAGVVRPAALGLVPVALLWILWIAWRVRNPCLRAAAVEVMSQALPESRRVDEASDVLLASMEPGVPERLRAVWRSLPGTARLAAPALGGILLGISVAIVPVTWRNWRVSGKFVPICVEPSVSALVAALPVYEGLDDSDVGAGSRLDRVADYAHLATAAGDDSPGVIARHFGRRHRLLLRREPEATASSLARRLKLFWGPLEVGSSSVVEYDRRDSELLRRLPVPFSVVNALSILGLAFYAVPRRNHRGVWATTSSPPVVDMPSALVVHALPALVCGLLVVWLWRHLGLLSAGVWRQPMLPLLALMASVAVEDLAQCLGTRRWRDAGVWSLTLFCCWMVVGQNLGQYVPNRAKWLLDRGLALEKLGQPDAAQTAFRTVLMVTPGLVDPESGVRMKDATMSEGDVRRFQTSAAVAAMKLASDALSREDRALAVRYYQLAAGLDTSRSEALVNAGVLVLGGGNPPEAVKLLREALRRDPRALPARYPLAQALYRLGRYDEAREEVDALLALMPDHAPARNLRAMLVPAQ